jgi:hypothetical protein
MAFRKRNKHLAEKSSPSRSRMRFLKLLATLPVRNAASSRHHVKTFGSLADAPRWRQICVGLSN